MKNRIPNAAFCDIGNIFENSLFFQEVQSEASNEPDKWETVVAKVRRNRHGEIIETIIDGESQGIDIEADMADRDDDLL